MTEEVMTQLKEAALRTGLVVNGNKRKYMKIKRNALNLGQYLIPNGHVF